MVGLASIGIPSISAAAPATPIPLSPQGDIYLCDDLLHNANFKWTAVSGATGYTMQIATVTDFTSILVNYSAPVNQVYLGGINLSPGIYYWRVQSFNIDGTSPWSTILSFHAIPSSPVLVFPGANAFVSPNPTFVWTTCFPFDTQFQLSNRPDFSNILIDLNFNANQYIYKGPYVYEYKFYWPLPCGMYWWRVRTKLGTEMSSWVSQLFSVIVPPSIAPIIISPTVNIIPTNKVDLKWSYINNADRYQIQICKGNVSLLDTIIYTNEYKLFGEDNTIYCFRVRAGNPVGWGPWSEWRQFKILLPPPAPRIMYPSNNTVFQTNVITIDWTRIDTAEYYVIEITDFTGHVVLPYSLKNNTLQFKGEYQHSYSVRLKAVNQSGESPWSQSIWFRIEENIPPRLGINSYSQYTNQPSIVISGKVYDLESGIDALCWGPNPIPIAADGNFQITFALQEGPNSFTLIAIDKAGNKTQKTIDVFKDSVAPEITISFPISPLYPVTDVFTVINDIEIKGIVQDLLPVTLIINNEYINIKESGNFVYQTRLNYGQNKVYIRAIDGAGNATEKIIKIYKTFNPTFVFKINNPQIFVQVIDKDGKLTWQVEEIDPGRYTVPIIVKGRVFIPVRKFIELINGSVDWDAETQKITIKVPARGKTIELWIGKPLARVVDTYGKEQWIQIEKGDNTITPFIRNDRSYFPLRFIVEQLNAVVEWDQVLQQVIIEFPIVP
ncbi:MAG: hypothetical protein GYA31_02130 [Parcubacteria group bacterium]|nr:hypothetical protein [Parcubacteria group bacterium]